MFFVSCYSLNGSLHSVVTKNFFDFMGQMGILETQKNVGLFPADVRIVCTMDRQNEWRKF